MAQEGALKRVRRIAAILVVVLTQTALPARALVPALWVSDDVTRMNYLVTGEGALLLAFASPAQIPSSISIDPSDGTLWSAVEGTPPDFPGRIVNFSRSGTRLSVISETEYGGVRSEGVAVDFSDYTLWVVDDPETGQIPMVFHLQRDGTPISSFPTSDFDPKALSPQAIGVDPQDGTLWVTDNTAFAGNIYNVRKDGSLVASFPVGRFDTAVRNPQGISVDPSDATLWVSARDTHTIYHISRSGTLISSFRSTAYDATSPSLNPTGVAVDPTIDLGDASRFALLGLDGVRIHMRTGSGVDGDAAVGARGKLLLSNAVVTGAYVVDPAARRARIRSARILGGTVREKLATAVAAARQASAHAAAEPPAQRLGIVRTTTTLTAAGSSTVLAVKSIDLSQGQTLTLAGGYASGLTVNVSGRLKLRRGSAIVLAGLTPGRVLFNVIGHGGRRVDVSGGSTAVGIFLAPNARASFRDSGTTVRGAVVAGRAIVVAGGARISYAK